MKNQTRDYYRHHRIRTIRRKYKILKQLWEWQMVENYFSQDGWSGVALGTLSKGKIHCFCPMCQKKSYDELSLRDKRQVKNMEQQLKEYQYEQ